MGCGGYGSGAIPNGVVDYRSGRDGVVASHDMVVDRSKIWRDTDGGEGGRKGNPSRACGVDGGLYAAVKGSGGDSTSVVTTASVV